MQQITNLGLEGFTHPIIILILLSPELSSHEVGVDYPSEGWAVT